jgi:O-antigen/teichoic acid export membrane protein
MSLKLQAVKNVTATWMGVVVHAAVGFFLSPFILHRLGDEAFSLWVLVFALTGYFGLLDLGIRTSVVKYTAKFTANRDEKQLSEYLSTSLAFYGAVGLLILLLTAVGFFWLGSVFRIPVRLLASARILFLLSGIGVALSFPLGLFAGVLEGLQKFAWLQLTQIGLTLLRAALIVLALASHGGLLAIGAITVALNLLGYGLFAWMALRILPGRLRFAGINKQALFKMASYGVFAFAIIAAEKLRFQSDAMVIGACLSSTAITFFAIGSKLVEYSSYAVRSMSQIFTPMSSQFDATGDVDRLRRALIAGNRASAFIVFPLSITLVVLGKSIIEAWVGARYRSSYYVLIVLLVPRTFYLVQSASTKVLLGMGRHRALASVLLMEGAANLVLSFLLARPLGIVGVALGTAIPLTCTSLLFLPQHTCRVLNLPGGTLLGQSYGLPLLLSLPFGAVLWFISERIPVHSATTLILEIAIGGAVYALGLAGCLWNRGFHPARPWQAITDLLEPNRQ